jgi:hypothetical protein
MVSKNNIDKKTYYFHNNAHIGDCLVSLHFLKKLCEKNNIFCEFSCNQNYIGENINQLIELVKSTPNIKISFNQGPNSIELWYPVIARRIENNPEKEYPFFCSNYPEFEDVFRLWFGIGNQVAEELGLNKPFKKISDVLFDENEISEIGMLNPETLEKEHFDFLIVNSYCMSGQMKWNQSEHDVFFDQIVRILQENNKKFITTKKVHNVPCTLDTNQSLVGIAKISKQCDYILGVPTSPFLICANKWSFKNCKKIINITHDYLTFDMGNKFQNCEMEKFIKCVKK